MAHNKKPPRVAGADGSLRAVFGEVGLRFGDQLASVCDELENLAVRLLMPLSHFCDLRPQGLRNKSHGIKARCNK